MSSLTLNPIVGTYNQIKADNQQNVEIVSSNKDAQNCNFCSVDWLNNIKASPFELSLDITFLQAYDLQGYAVGGYTLSPSKINQKKDDDYPNPFGSFVGVELGFSTEVNLILPTTLHFSVEKDLGESTLALKKYYVKNAWLTIGKDAGNFCTYKAEALRYSTHLIKFTHKVNDSFSYAIAIEEALVTTKADDDAKYTENKKASVNSVDANKVNIETTDTEPLKAVFTTPSIMSRIAATGSFSYSWSKGNVQFSGIFAIPSYFQGDMANQKNEQHAKQTMWGAALSSKFVLMEREEYKNKEKFVISAHVKFKDGLVGYHTEAGGFPKKDLETAGKDMTLDGKGNFFSDLDEEGKEKKENISLTTIKYLGGSLTGKFFYNPIFYSAFAGEFLYIVNGDKATVADNLKFRDACTLKIVPFGISLFGNLVIEPTYRFGSANMFKIGNSTRKYLHRLEIMINVNASFK